MIHLDDQDVFEEPRFDYGDITVYRFRTFDEAKRRMLEVDQIYFEASIAPQGTWWNLRIQERV